MFYITFGHSVPTNEAFWSCFYKEMKFVIPLYCLLLFFDEKYYVN